MANDVRIIYQDGPDGPFVIGEHRLNESELGAFIALTPDQSFIFVYWGYPQSYLPHRVRFSNDNIVRYEKLSDETLYKIRDGLPLEQAGFDDVVHSTINN